MDPQVFINTTIAEIHDKARDYQQKGWRFVALTGSTVPGGVELLYSFSDFKEFEQLRLVAEPGATVPAVSDIFFNALVFENEVHDLFGVNIKDIAIDFGGKFYGVSVPTPMNPQSPFVDNSFTVTYRDSKSADQPTDGQEGGN
ncbi:MAG: NADH-quinone oxidoreductase subunit C [Actinomycetia bacterium]|nr:NADH-quinone oxidoreductase subunit C [Actinomycetes bacterium]